MAMIEDLHRRLFPPHDNTANGFMSAAMEIDLTVFQVGLVIEQLRNNAEMADADHICAASAAVLALLAKIAPAIDHLAAFCPYGSRQELLDAANALADGPHERAAARSGALS